MFGSTLRALAFRELERVYGVEVLAPMKISLAGVRASTKSQVFVGYGQDRLLLSSQIAVGKIRRLLELCSEPLPLQGAVFDNEAPVVVHYRRGDYARNPRIGMVSDEYFFRAFAQLPSAVRTGRVWLFTDSEQVAANPPEWMHNPRVMPIADMSPVTILRLMTYGHGFVLSNSTFGWWAAALSGVSPTKIVAPKPWMVSVAGSEDTVPLEWRREPR